MLAALRETLLIGSHRIKRNSPFAIESEMHLGTRIAPCNGLLEGCGARNWKAAQLARNTSGSSENANIASNLVTVYIFPRLVTVTRGGSAPTHVKRAHHLS